MTDQVLINATPQETRVALVENGELREVRIERRRSRGVVGNIYRGVVMRVLPGMQAAFVDIGLERNAFVHVRDLVPEPGPAAGPRPPIASLLRQGQKITVQAIKNPIGDKGARLSGRIGIASRSLVYLPGGACVGISRRVADPAVRASLWSAFAEVRGRVGAEGGFIVRTAAADAGPGEMRADLEFVVRAWRRIVERQHLQPPPALLHHNLSLAMRTVRDLPWRRVARVLVDCEETCRQVREFAAELVPHAVERIRHYADARPVFDLYAVEEDIGRALGKRVPLKSGGHLIFDQTEAMTTVDVNTGSFVGRRDFAETVFQTNLEAVAALVRQIRLRNIGGIIIVDFIDMDVEQHRARVMDELERALARDSTKARASRMSSLGLVAITRKRTSESLERLLTEPCPTCRGRGARKTAQSTCYEIFREIRRRERLRRAAGNPAPSYQVAAAGAVVDWLREKETDGLDDLQQAIGRAIQLRAEPDYHPEQFDVLPD